MSVQVNSPIYNSPSSFASLPNNTISPMPGPASLGPQTGPIAQTGPIGQSPQTGSIGQSPITYGQGPMSVQGSSLTNPYKEIDPQLINYSSLFYEPNQLASGLDPIIPYTNALISGNNPTAYINSPILPGNRYFINTQTQCTYSGDPEGVTHNRSVLVDNVLQSSVNNLGNTSTGQNTGLMYSLLASLNNLTSSIVNPTTNALQLPVQTGSTPLGSNIPNPAASYLSSTPIFPACVPVSVYIDGTNVATASAWVSPSDYQAIDPAAISQNTTMEGFTPIVIDPKEAAASIGSPGGLGGLVEKTKSVASKASLNSTCKISKSTDATTLASKKKQYQGTYTKPTGQTSDMNCYPIIRDASSGSYPILNLFQTLVTYEQNYTLTIANEVTGLSSNSNTTLGPIIPYSKIVSFFTDPSGQALYNQILNASYVPEFIKQIEQFTTNNDASAYITNIINGAGIPPQDLSDASLNLLSTLQETYVKLQQAEDQYENRTGFYNQIDYSSIYTDPSCQTSDIACLMNSVNTKITDLLTLQTNIKTNYCQFITDLEIYRDPIILFLANYDFIPTSPPECSSTEGFQTQYYAYQDTHKSILDDPLILLYLSALLGLGLYMFYRIYRKHGYK